MCECINCGELIDGDHAYCNMCDELYDVIDRSDTISARGARSPREEEYVAMGTLAYDLVQERRGAFRGVDIGEGCRWVR
jgi:methyl coenzyme M reductase alpha subunit